MNSTSQYSPANNVLCGNRLGRYRLITELGRGGMGTVFLAVASEGIQDVRKPVVIKLINEDLLADPEFVKLFAREAKIAAELSHPNVVVTHTVGQEAGRYYIVMEYLEGVTLRDVLACSEDWPLQDRLPLLGAMCLALTGLGYVHEFQDYRGEHLGLVHRDIKPDNIFLTTNGQVKLLDFGVAKARAGEFEATLGMPIRGTLQYMAPEGVTPGAAIDHRWDVFSAGVILAEIATGHRYWGRLGHTQILSRLAAGELPPLQADSGEEVPPPLARIIERALAPDPAQRFESAHHLRRVIQPFLSKQGYRVDASALARIVSHLYEPIRGGREATLRACLGELDRTHTPASVASESQSEATFAADSGTEPGQSSRPQVEATLPANSGPARRHWSAYAAILLALLLVPLSWTVVRGCTADNVDEAARTRAVAARAGHAEPVTPPATPAPTNVAPQSLPTEVSATVNEATVGEAGGGATVGGALLGEVTLSVPAAPVTPPAPTAESPDGTSTVQESAGAMPPKRKTSGRKRAKEPPPGGTGSNAASTAASAAKPAAASEIEPSPYTR